MRASLLCLIGCWSFVTAIPTGDEGHQHQARVHARDVEQLADLSRRAARKTPVHRLIDSLHDTSGQPWWLLNLMTAASNGTAAMTKVASKHGYDISNWQGFVDAIPVKPGSPAWKMRSATTFNGTGNGFISAAAIRLASKQLYEPSCTGNYVISTPDDLLGDNLAFDAFNRTFRLDNGKSVVARRDDSTYPPVYSWTNNDKSYTARFYMNRASWAPMYATFVEGNITSKQSGVVPYQAHQAVLSTTTGPPSKTSDDGLTPLEVTGAVFGGGLIFGGIVYAVVKKSGRDELEAANTRLRNEEKRRTKIEAQLRVDPENAELKGQREECLANIVKYRDNVEVVKNAVAENLKGALDELGLDPTGVYRTMLDAKARNGQIELNRMLSDFKPKTLLRQNDFLHDYKKTVSRAFELAYEKVRDVQKQFTSKDVVNFDWKALANEKLSGKDKKMYDKLSKATKEILTNLLSKQVNDLLKQDPQWKAMEKAGMITASMRENYAKQIGQTTYESGLGPISQKYTADAMVERAKVVYKAYDGTMKAMIEQGERVHAQLNKLNKDAQFLKAKAAKLAPDTADRVAADLAAKKAEEAVTKQEKQIKPTEERAEQAKIDRGEAAEKSKKMEAQHETMRQSTKAMERRLVE